MAVRSKPAAAPAQTAGIEERLGAIEAENAVLARAICALAVARPGGNPGIDRILTLELRMARDDAAVIISAAKRTG